MFKHLRVIFCLAAVSDLLGVGCVMAYLSSPPPSENLLLGASIAALFAVVSFFLLAGIVIWGVSRLGHTLPMITQFNGSQPAPSYADSLPDEQFRQRWTMFMARIDNEQRYFCTLANAPCPVWSACDPRCVKKPSDPADQPVQDS